MPAAKTPKQLIPVYAGTTFINPRYIVSIDPDTESNRATVILVTGVQYQLEFTFKQIDQFIKAWD